MRVAFGGISHETNTFATRALGLTGRESFRPMVGDQILKGSKVGYMGGMLDAARAWREVASSQMVPICLLSRLIKIKMVPDLG